jgi:succinate dehydrogenase / fumarate reductase cytochrome b subunit
MAVSVVTLYRSSIGKKAVMALTGAIMWGFLILHMVGNLHVFEGRERFNEYAGFLRTVGSPALANQSVLWTLRVVLLVAVVLHIAAAYQTSRQSYAARPVRYQHPDTVQADPASRTMRWGGIAIALFIAYHLLHMTTGTLHGSFVEGDVYHNVVSGFRVWWVSAVYIAAIGALGMHLYHGVWSVFQTSGRMSTRMNHAIRAFAATSTIVLCGGFISVPVAVLTHVVK